MNINVIAKDAMNDLDRFPFPLFSSYPLSFLSMCLPLSVRGGYSVLLFSDVYTESAEAAYRSVVSFFIRNHPLSVAFLYAVWECFPE